MIFCVMPREPMKRPVRRYLKNIVCAGCGKEAGVRRRAATRVYCADCQIKSMRRKDTLRYHVKRAIKAGKLADPRTLKCTDCELMADRYDHRDWSKPLEVEPVCHGCNVRRGHAANLHEVA